MSIMTDWWKVDNECKKKKKKIDKKRRLHAHNYMHINKIESYITNLVGNEWHNINRSKDMNIN